MIAKIGLTGGIGSGKTTVAKIFEQFGYEVYYADIRAKWLSNNDIEVRNQLIYHFGAGIYTSEGLDRKKLAGIVFKDKNQLELLNSIIHPATYRDFEKWFAGLSAEYSKNFILKEAAILFEAGSWKNLDGIITVYAPESIRIARVCSRDRVEPEAVRARMQNQIDEQFKRDHSDFIIYNDGQHMLIPQVRSAIEYFSRKFNS